MKQKALAHLAAVKRVLGREEGKDEVCKGTSG